MQRRALLSGLGAATALTGCRAGGFATRDTTAIYIPGYFPGDAVPRNEPADSARRRASGDPMTLITRIDTGGRITQAAFPIIGHDIAIAPDRSVGFFGRMGETRTGAHHIAFDPQTLEMLGQGQPPGAGWRGGGHGLFLPDGTLLSTERAPLRGFAGRPADHRGRLVRRDAETLAIVDTLPCHGIDPHELRLSPDGHHVAVANYGSVPRPGTAELGQPRHVIEAGVTLVDLASGALVARHASHDPEHELRHLALGRGTIFGMRARLGLEGAERALQREISAAGRDITADPGESYLAAAPLLFTDALPEGLPLATDQPGAHLRHGLSVEYDPAHDEFIASFPSSHRLMVFAGNDGALLRSIDTRERGLDYPSGIALLPDGAHYAVAGYWRDLHIIERGSHRHVRALSHHPVLFGHSHMAAA